MTAIQDIVQEIKRALEKPTPEEREIALRVVEASQAKRLKELEASAKEQSIKTIDAMIIDCMSAPGMPSAYQGCSPQDVLVALRGQVAAQMGIDASALTTEQVTQKMKVRETSPKPRTAIQGYRRK